MRLGKLTTINSENARKTIDEVYPAHAEAMKIAKLTSKFPTLADAHRSYRAFFPKAHVNFWSFWK